MGKAITLFSGYSQRENRTTNYCLLILKMLYEENPKFLSDVLGVLVGEDLGRYVGVQFRQQEKRSASTPDGLISQDAFTIYIETKNFDWFYDDQLARHLEDLGLKPGLKVLLALANFPDENDARFRTILKLCAEKYKGQIVFQQVSFEDLIGAIEAEHLPKNLADAVIDFRGYLDEQNLLPSWKRFLDVINCAGSSEDVLRENVYMCPATGGSYSHQRCKFFGMYQNKRVECVALIDAVVDVEDEQKASVRWHNNTEKSEQELCKIAQEKVVLLRAGDFPKRVFLLGRLFETDFHKGTPGGMQTSKQYFDVSYLGEGIGPEALASKLRGKTWSEVRSHPTE